MQTLYICNKDLEEAKSKSIWICQTKWNEMILKTFELLKGPVCRIYWHLAVELLIATTSHHPFLHRDETQEEVPVFGLSNNMAVEGRRRPTDLQPDLQTSPVVLSPNSLKSYTLDL